jgi:hypothetical protein
MTMVYDKNKCKFMPETERIKPKNGNIQKNHNKSKSDKNSSLFKEYVFSSPFKNIIKNNKKSNYINLYQNNNNRISNNYKPTNNNNNNTKKNHSIKKLKYNKSFELNMNKNIISNNNFDFLNDNLYTINYNKHKNSKNFNNNSVILNNKSKKLKTKNNYRSVTRSGNTHGNSNSKQNNDMLIKKLDEKFLSLESNIIDQKYENDIDHDEMIITSNRKNINIKSFDNNTNNNKENNAYKLSNILGFNKSSDINDDLYLNVNKNNKNNIEIDENYLLNTSFENQRSDFSIMYTYDYEKTVMDDLLSLEIKLLVEKMLEMQKSYHKELNIILNQYNTNSEIFKLLIEKISFYKKKIYILQKMEEKKSTNGNIYNFINIYHNNNKHEICKINKNEFYLWKNNIFGKNKNNIYDKEKLRQIFKIIVFDKYYKISTKVNNIENKIILGLMKKYKYNKNNDTKLINNSDYKPNNNKNYKSKANKNNSSSPIQAYKNVSKKNKNDNSEKTNKIKHKKISSCSQPKQANFYIFKNNKQK